MSRLQGKVILVTGAAQCIGKECAVACLKAGATVIAVDIQKGKLAQLQFEYPGILIQRLDITIEDEVKDVIHKYTSNENPTLNINSVFNCAGIVPIGSAHDTDVADWDKCFDVNAKGMFFVCKYLIQKWLQLDIKGNIINMASITSSIKGVPERFAYAASKAAVIGMTKSIAVDYIEKGIRANAICPATIQTPDLNAEYFKLCGNGDEEKGRQHLLSRQKMGRFGKMDEIAALVVYLTSEESAFMTGGEIKIDGGWSL